MPVVTESVRDTVVVLVFATAVALLFTDVFVLAAAPSPKQEEGFATPAQSTSGGGVPLQDAETTRRWREAVRATFLRHLGRFPTRGEQDAYVKVLRGYEFSDTSPPGGEQAAVETILKQSREYLRRVEGEEFAATNTAGAHVRDMSGEYGEAGLPARSFPVAVMSEFARDSNDDEVDDVFVDRRRDRMLPASSTGHGNGTASGRPAPVPRDEGADPRDRAYGRVAQRSAAIRDAHRDVYGSPPPAYMETLLLEILQKLRKREKNGLSDRQLMRRHLRNVAMSMSSPRGGDAYKFKDPTPRALVASDDPDDAGVLDNGAGANIDASHKVFYPPPSSSLAKLRGDVGGAASTPRIDEYGGMLHVRHAQWLDALSC